MSEGKAARLTGIVNRTGAAATNWGRILARVVAALSALALGAPIVHAGCDSGVPITQPQAGRIADAERTSGNPFTHGSEKPSGGRPRPCSGPTCSGRSPLLPVSSIPVPAPQPEWACLAVPPALANPEVRWHLWRAGAISSVRIAVDVFRPPRRTGSPLPANHCM